MIVVWEIGGYRSRSMGGTSTIPNSVAFVMLSTLLKLSKIVTAGVWFQLQ